MLGWSLRNFAEMRCFIFPMVVNVFGKIRSGFGRSKVGKNKSQRGHPFDDLFRPEGF